VPERAPNACSKKFVRNGRGWTSRPCTMFGCQGGEAITHSLGRHPFQHMPVASVAPPLMSMLRVRQVPSSRSPTLKVSCVVVNGGLCRRRSLQPYHVWRAGRGGGGGGGSERLQLLPVLTAAYACEAPCVAAAQPTPACTSSPAGSDHCTHTLCPSPHNSDELRIFILSVECLWRF
jgi:hypothetical protein